MNDRLNHLVLTGDLRSSSSDKKISIELVNDLLIPIKAIWLDMDGRLDPELVVKVSAGKHEGIESYAKHFWIVTSKATGGFITVLQIPDTNKHKQHVNVDELETPNHLGEPPVPTPLSPIPGNSKPVVVGIGESKNNSVIIREQFWSLSHNDSFSLVPGERRFVEIREESGVERSDAVLKTIATQVGTQFSGGWAAISASISASLSASSSRSTSVTLTERQIRTEQRELVNQSQVTSLVLAWQLMDRYTWWEQSKDNPKLLNTLLVAQPLILLRQSAQPN